MPPTPPAVPAKGKKKPLGLLRSERSAVTCLIGFLIVGRVLPASQSLVVSVEILRHLEMSFEHGNRLIDIDPHIGIARKFALGPTERSKSFLMIANIHPQESFVELRAFQIVELILSRLVLFIRFQLDVFLTGQRLESRLIVL